MHLIELEASDEIARVGAAATSEWQKGQAWERMRQQPARWRVRKRRVTLQGLVGDAGETTPTLNVGRLPGTRGCVRGGAGSSLHK